MKRFYSKEISPNVRAEFVKIHRFVCVDLTRRKLVIGNLGDGEAVLCRKEKAVHMSPVHNPGRVDENRRIVEANGWVTTEQVMQSLLEEFAEIFLWNIWVQLLRTAFP